MTPMNESTLLAVKIVFLLGFTLHNIEEALWLPRWSKLSSVRKFHEPVDADQFLFAVLVVTMIGYILTALDILVGPSQPFVRYTYLGFIGMMGGNAFFPHLVVTVALKRYAPGVITGLCLNLPLAFIIMIGSIKNGLNLYVILLAMLLVTIVILTLLCPLFKLGSRLTNFSGG